MSGEWTIHGKSWQRYNWPAACVPDYPIGYVTARQFYAKSIVFKSHNNNTAINIGKYGNIIARMSES